MGEKVDKTAPLARADPRSDLGGLGLSDVLSARALAEGRERQEARARLWVLWIGRLGAMLAAWHLWGGWGSLLAFALCLAAQP